VRKGLTAFYALPAFAGIAVACGCERKSVKRKPFPVSWLAVSKRGSRSTLMYPAAIARPCRLISHGPVLRCTPALDVFYCLGTIALR
jgi:hypothetical protein